MSNPSDPWGQQGYDQRGPSQAQPGYDQQGQPGYDQPTQAQRGPSQAQPGYDQQGQPGYDQPTQAQPGYDQPSQPGYDQTFGQQPWDQVNGQQGNGQSSYGQQPWDQGNGQQPWDQPAATAPYYSSPYAMVPQEQSKGQGVTALLLAAGALVISLVFSYFCADAYKELFQLMGTIEVDTTDLSPEAQAATTRAGMFIIAQGVPTIMGILALVFGFMSLSKQTRTAGIWGIILAFAAPVISFIFWIYLLADTFMAMS